MILRLNLFIITSIVLCCMTSCTTTRATCKYRGIGDSHLEQVDNVFADSQSLSPKYLSRTFGEMEYWNHTQIEYAISRLRCQEGHGGYLVVLGLRKFHKTDYDKIASFIISRSLIEYLSKTINVTDWGLLDTFAASKKEAIWK